MAVSGKEKRAQAQVQIKDPLDVVPVVAENVEAKKAGKSHLQLRRQVYRKGKMKNFFARLLKFRNYRYIDLDEMGAFFWKQIDNRKKLKDIARSLKDRYSFDQKQCEEAAIEFTKSLLVRNFIQLKIDTKEAFV